MSAALLTRPDWHNVPEEPLRRVSDQMTEPTTLDDAFARGGDSVLRAAYDEHGSFVYSLCRRTVGEDLAADITQEVFVAAWRQRASYDPARGSLGAWLTGITRHKIVDVLRREARHRNERLDSSNVLLDVSDPVEWVRQLGDRMLLADAMEALTERARAVIELAFVEDLTHEQIAASTGIPLGTVKSDVRRGLDRLRRHIDFDPPTGET
ncbi:MAG: sigma-70 family RNA polymerase sigma factor [Ilumatobacter sp.]|nr:sigma-70 family RNA polymerase sigma factor [Ilumatobacter sp.]